MQFPHSSIRLYSDRDIALLQRVKALVDDMGINLPGVEVILRMVERMEDMQRELEETRQELQDRRNRNL